MTLFVQIISVDEFKAQICHDYPNCVISSLLLPDSVRQSPPKSHDLPETAMEKVRTHPQSSIELPTRDLCCSSCGKAGVGSCSSKRTAGVSESEKQNVESRERELSDRTQPTEEAKGLHVSETGDAANEKKSGSEEQNVESGERELSDQIQSLEEAKGVDVSEAGDTAADEKKSSEGDVLSVDAKFSNEDDVITQASRLGTKGGGKSDSQTSGGDVSKDTMDDDATRTDVNSGILLQGSSSVETDTKVRKLVVQYQQCDLCKSLGWNRK